MGNCIRVFLILVTMYSGITNADDSTNDLDTLQATSNINDADEVADTADTVSQVLNQKVTIKKQFNDIKQVTAVINNLTEVNTKVVTESADKSTANINQTSGTMLNFLNKVTKRLHYTWKLADNNTILFNAINPKKIQTVPQDSSGPLSGTTTIALHSLQPQTWILNGAVDKTIRTGLTKWAKLAGWQLIWKSNVDYEIEADAVIAGTFDEAINEICRASQFTNKQLMAEFHAKNKVLVIYTPTLK